MSFGKANMGRYSGALPLSRISSDMLDVGQIPSNRGASFRFRGWVPGGRTRGSGVGITELYIPEDRFELRETIFSLHPNWDGTYCASSFEGSCSRSFS